MRSMAIPAVALEAARASCPELQLGDLMLICDDCSITVASSQHGSATDQLSRELERILKWQNGSTGVIGKRCQGVSFTFEGVNYRRCLWNSEILAGQEDGEKCSGCGRVVRDKPTAVQSVPATGVLLWIEELGIWQSFVWAVE